MPRQYDEMRQTIIGAARDHFHRFGLSKTTLDDIAKAVRMAKSSLYYYFRDKETLFSAVLDTEIESFKERLLDSLVARKSVRGKLQSYVVVRMKCLKEFARFFPTFKDEYLMNYGFVEKIRSAYDQFELKTISGMLEEGVASGECRRLDVDLTAFAILTAMKGLEYQWTTVAAEEEIEKNVEMLLDVLFNGIARK